MKHSFALHTALACALVLPAVTIEARQGEPLEQSLLRTVKALESLAGIQNSVSTETVETPDPRAITTVLQWTEQPLLATERPDDQLVALRQEVSRLQSEYDLIEADAAMDRAPVAGIDYTLPDPEVGAPVAPTTGLDDAARELLASIREPAPRTRPGQAQAQAQGVEVSPVQGTQERVRFEPEGYTADALRLARVWYRLGRWQDAVDTLAEANDPESVYWRARALERLDRNEDALADYRSVMAMPDAGAVSARAREDSEFLEWRLSFEKRLGKGGDAPK